MRDSKRERKRERERKKKHPTKKITTTEISLHYFLSSLIKERERETDRLNKNKRRRGRRRARGKKNPVPSLFYCCCFIFVLYNFDNQIFPYFVNFKFPFFFCIYNHQDQQIPCFYFINLISLVFLLIYHILISYPNTSRPTRKHIINIKQRWMVIHIFV